MMKGVCLRSACTDDDTDVEERSSAPCRWAPPEAHVFVVLEGDDPSAGGMRASLSDIDEVILGRSDAREIKTTCGSRRLALSIPDRSASTAHARLIRRKDGWRIDDVGSTNGTFVNGLRTAGRDLADGDIFQIGRTVLRLRLAVPTPEGTPRVTVGSDLSNRRLEMVTLLPALAQELVPVERAAATNLPVLLLGETGTGKEVIARAI